METTKRTCHYCGAEIQDQQRFCTNCGASSEMMFSSFQTAEFSQKRYTNWSTKRIVIIFIAVLLSIAVLVAVVSHLLWVCSPDGLCAKMLYTDAYQLANGAEKDAVLAENAIAYVCGEVIIDLYYPDDFVLNNGYYIAYVDEYGSIEYQFVLLAMTIKGIDGRKDDVLELWGSTGYENEWGKWTDMSSLASSQNDEFDIWLAKAIGKVTMVRGTCASAEQLKRINGFADKHMLDDIELINAFSIDTSRFLLDKEFVSLLE